MVSRWLILKLGGLCGMYVNYSVLIPLQHLHIDKIMLGLILRIGPQEK